MDNKVKISMHNKFQIEVVDGKTNEVKQKAQAYNIVCDNLWHYVIETTTAFATCIQYGSGSGTPSASDTSLFTRAGGAGVSEVSLTCDYMNKLITRVCKIVLGLNDAVGVTITEVGMAAGTGNGSLATHAMLQDMNGNPISIEKTNTDIINIYATVYCHWEIGDEHMSFHPSTAMQQSLTGIGNIFGSFTAGFGFNNFYGDASKTWTKTSAVLNTKKITYTAPRYNQSEGNIIGGIEWILGSGSYAGVGIKKGTNSFGATTITNESVGTGDGETTTFRTKNSFPYNATVYVNGVAQTSAQVTVLKETVFNNQDRAYLVLLEDGATENDRRVKCDYIGFWGSGTYVFYNPFYQTNGIERFSSAGASSGSFNTYNAELHVYSSNNLDDWTDVGSASNRSAQVNIPAEHQNDKYFKLVAVIGGGYGWYTSSQSIRSTKSDYDNIIFNTAPADGDVITISYTTDCIPKDSDHVLDATFTLEFGNYIPAS